MKRWAFVVAGLYLLVLVGLTMPVTIAAFSFGHDRMIAWNDVSRMGEVYLEWPYWVWIAVMVLAQAALLTTPVKVASRRPVTHRSLWLPVIGTGLMLGGLAVGAIYSVMELIFKNQALDNATGLSLYGPLVVGAITWCIWSVIFYRLNRNAEPSDLISRQCRLLLKGSILELLIAVPTHIVARSRDYCCAGLMTFIGLTMGISVMLFSFGPAVFFLYVARWRRLHPD